MSDPKPSEVFPGIDAWYVELMGRAAMDLRTRLKRFAVHDGDRRRLAPCTPRPPLDLKLVENLK